MKTTNVVKLFATVLMLLTLSCCSKESKGPSPSEGTSIAAERISPQLAVAKIRAGALVVDVRSGKEFAEGHLVHAINIPHAEIANLAAREPDKQREIILYCASGRRAALAQESLGRLGYRNVFNAGGFSELSREESNGEN